MTEDLIPNATLSFSTSDNGSTDVMALAKRRSPLFSDSTSDESDVARRDDVLFERNDGPSNPFGDTDPECVTVCWQCVCVRMSVCV